MNNLIHTSPSRGEVEMMAQTRDILNSLEQPSTAVGNYSGQRLYENTTHRPAPIPMHRPIPPTFVPDDPQQAVEAMKKIRESLDNLFDDPSPNTREIMENKKSYISQSDNNSWEVVVSLDTTGNRIYNVKNESREVFNNINFNLFESAYTIAKILNKNKSTNRIDDIIELDEEFRTYRSESTLSKKNYNDCIKINESESAVIYNTRYKNAQQKAIAIQEVVKNILKSI